jgi:CDP-diacylglycerol---glycerol-3-phosphate 3-phosphatidyltransferase
VSNWKESARQRVRPVVLTLDRWGFSPLVVSLVGLAITLLGCYLVARGSLFLGTLIFLLGSAFDMLDGALARMQGTVSARGAFLDSVLDRFGEAAFLTGVGVWYMNRLPDNWDLAILLILVTMFGSLATSYVRARAEGVGETCYVGVLQRTERVIILGAGALLGHVVLFGVLWILAVGTMVTTIQRIVHVAGKLPGPGPRHAVLGHAVGADLAPEKLEPERDAPGHDDEHADLDGPR